VYLFIERETYRWQKLNEGIKKVDNELEIGFNTDQAKEDQNSENYKKNRADRIERFWMNIKTFIIERLCKKLLKKRDNVSDEKLLEWIHKREPEMVFNDLSDYNKKRIENEDVMRQFEGNPTQNLKTSKTSNVFYSSNFFNKNQSKKPMYDIARDEIWKPIVWLHQKQLVDDFIFFTILSELCTTHKEPIAFNIKQ